MDASGAPLVGAEVAHWPSLGRHAPVIDPAGAFESAAFPAAEGDALAERPAGGGPTFHAALKGWGPWTVVQPDTRADFETSGTYGAPLAHFEVVDEGQVFAGSGGPLELRGLDANVVRPSCEPRATVPGASRSSSLRERMRPGQSRTRRRRSERGFFTTLAAPIVPFRGRRTTLVVGIPAPCLVPQGEPP